MTVTHVSFSAVAPGAEGQTTALLVQLVGEDALPVVGFVLGDDQQVVANLTLNSTTGTFAVDLVPNDEITPSGTVYKATLTSRGRRESMIFAVPVAVDPDDDEEVYDVGDLLTDVPGALTPSGLAAHLGDSTAAHVAASVGYTPSGTLAATDVQAAITELDSEKAGLAVENSFTVPQQFNAASGGPALYADQEASNGNTTGQQIRVRRWFTGDMSDGFGGTVAFYVRDDALVWNNIGDVVAQRWGTDDSGKVGLRPRSLNVSQACFWVYPNRVTEPERLVTLGPLAAPSHSHTQAVLASAVVGDGVSGDHAALQALLVSEPGKPIHLRAKTYYDAQGVIAVSDSLVLLCEPGTTLLKAHTGNALRIEPTAVVTGLTSSAQVAGDSTATFAGAAWTVDEHVGKWAVFVYEAAAAAWDIATTYAEGDLAKQGSATYLSLGDDNLGNQPSSTSAYWERLGTQRRRVASNTADTLTFADAFGGPITAGSALTFYTPIPKVHIRDLLIDGPGNGSANIVIQYVEELVLERLGSKDTAGNGLSVYSCDRVTIDDYYAEDVQFGFFVYGSTNVAVRRPVVKSWTAAYAGQLKDCVDGTIADGQADCEDNTGKVAWDIKASGLNPARNMSIVNSWGNRCKAPALKMHALANEGSFYSGENFQIRDGGAHESYYAFQVQAASGGILHNALVQGVQGYDCVVSGFSLNAPNADVRDIQIERSAYYAGSIGATATGSRLSGRFVDNSWNGSARPEILVAATDCVIDGDFVHSSASSNTVRAVEETGAANRNLIRGRIRDIVGDWTDDYLLLGAASRAIREHGFDTLAAATTVKAVDARPTTKVLSAIQAYTATAVLADIADLAHPLAKGGVYRFRLVLFADGDIAGDLQVAFTGPAAATLLAGLATAPQLGATGAGNQSSRHNAVAAFGSVLVAGMGGAGSRVEVAIDGTVTVGATAGTLQVQAAQQASHATATNVHAGSMLTVEKIA